MKTIQAYVQVTIASGDIFYYSSQVTIDVLSICHNAVFSPALSTQISTATKYSKTEFSESLFTTSNPSSGCPVAYAISTTTGSGIATPSGLNSLVDVSDTTNLKVTPTDATASGYAQHTFYIRATIARYTNTDRVEWTNLLTFVHGCGSWSTLDESGMVLSYNHNKFDVVQYIVPGFNVKTDRGGSQELTCTITDYELTTASSSVISPSGLTKEAGCSTLACTNYDVDTSSALSVQFHTKVTFEGGSSIYTTNQVTIIVLD